MPSAKQLMTQIRKAQEEGKTSFQWPPCTTCGHRRYNHAPEGKTWRCWHRKKRTGPRCDCMNYRGELKIS